MSGQQELVFGDPEPPGKPTSDQVRRLRVIVTVKAAPVPSQVYGETVCVAGLSVDPSLTGWVRLYPINFRFLDDGARFAKYDVVTVDAVPARKDSRRESWQPRMDSLHVERRLPTWPKRRTWIDSHVEQSMCRLYEDAKSDPSARSLGLVRAREVREVIVRPHPGWTPDEQSKINGYVQQLDLLSDADRTPLEAPRVQGWYRWRCHDPRCRGHEQGILDWEFVALQRRLRHLDVSALSDALRAKFLGEVCAPSRDVCFYVGNQAKRHHVFGVVGVYWPPRT